MRTPEEFAAGHPPGALNVPFVLNDANPGFLPAAAKVINKSDCHLLIGCKSGQRSAQASKALADAGYTHVLDVQGGWNAWAAANLPAQK